MNRLRTYGRLWLGCLILLAITVQGLIPLGFMPSINNNDGKVEIVICTGKGPATVLVDAHMVPGAADEQGDSHDDASACPFAPVLADGAAHLQPATLTAFAIENPPLHPQAAINTLFLKNWFSQGPPRA
jgi:hypothetical protein